MGAVLEQVLHEVVAHLADAGDADGAAGERGSAPGGLRGGPHALEDAVRREHRAVARPALGDRAPGHEAALLGDDVHVLGVGADVAGGVVAAVEGLHEAPVGVQQGGGLVGERVADDHGLAAAEVEPGHRGLVGHPAGEVQHVTQGVVVAAVGVEPGAAQRGAPGGGVDRDERAEAAALVGTDDDLLVPVEIVEQAILLWGHGGGPSCRYVALRGDCTTLSSWQGWTWTGLDYIARFTAVFKNPDISGFGRHKPGGTLRRKSKELRVTASLKGERRGNATDRNRITPHAR